LCGVLYPDIPIREVFFFYPRQDGELGQPRGL